MVSDSAKLEAFLQAINRIPIIFWMTDKDGIFTLSEGKGLELLGLKPGQVVGSSALELYKEFPDILDAINKALNGQSSRYTLHMQGTSLGIPRTETVLDIHTMPLKDENGDVNGVFGIAYDMTSQKQLENRLQRSTRRYQTIIDESPIPMLVMRHGVIILINKKALKLFGYDDIEELIGVSSTLLLSKSVRERLMQQTIDREAGEKVPEEYETLGLKRDGTEFPMFVYARSFEYDDEPAVMTFHIDLTETKRLEKERQEFQEQVIKSQKLESLGVLAGGIAHDFNNMLMGILGNAEIALLEPEISHKVSHHIQQIVDIAKKASDLSRQMLVYTGKGRTELQISNMNQIIEDMRKLVEISVSHSVTVSYDLAEDIWLTSIENSQIQQLVLNLVMNASEALGGENGTIVIRTQNQVVDESYRESFGSSTLEPGEYVLLEVEDNGPGISDVILNKIFDPFFSTKFTGRGLGLSVVQGIVNGHNGAINVYSELDKGTSFKILLPKADDKSVETSTAKKLASSTKHEGLALIVDDDANIRQVGETMLHHLGYTVLIAKNGIEALDILQTERENITFIILDLTMPVLTGRATYERIRQMHKSIPIILSSGYNEVATVDLFQNREFTSFLQKPYSLVKLEKCIQEILDFSEN